MPENIDDIMKIVGEAIEQFRPGGVFAETRTKQLAEKKRVAIPQMQAGLVSRGLAGTTVAAAIPSRFEMEIAKPFETETEQLRSARLFEAILAKAGFMERGAGRDLQRELAEMERDLREKLQKKQITSQEYMAALDRARQQAMDGLQQKAGGGGAGGGGAAGQIGGAAENFYAQPAGGYSGGSGGGSSEWGGVWSGGKRIDEPWFTTARGPQGVITGEKKAPGAEGARPLSFFGQMGQIGEQFLTQPQPSPFGGEVPGATMAGNLPLQQTMQRFQQRAFA